MQQTRLPTLKEPELPASKEKAKRFLRPSPFIRNGRRLYSNELGQEFFSRVRPDGGSGNYSIEIFQLGEGKPIARFSAAAQLTGKVLMIKFMTRVGWEPLPGRKAPAPTGYCASRIIFNEAISLAQKEGADKIYLKAISLAFSKYYESLGFEKIPELKNSEYLQFRVPAGASKP